LVAADGSQATRLAVAWGADLAQRYAADLLVVKVVAPEHVVGAGADDASGAESDLAALVQDAGGARAVSRVLFEPDPAATFLRVAEEEKVDIVVVGNAGMGGRSEFLLGNVPNRISHNARCTVVIVNSAAQDGAAPTRSEAPDRNAEPVAGELLGRAAQIGSVMAQLAAKELFGARDSGEGRVEATAKRFRDALERLGPSFAKLGQVLSTRPDLLPRAVIDQLATLQDRVAPLTEAEVVAVMERELHVPWEDVFQRIEPEPMAAGTIAQVHRAVLATGERVVVKVQRPNAEADILRDLRLLEMFSEKASSRPEFRRVVDLPAMIGQLSDSLRQELDFRHEAANVERMRTILAPFSRLAVPDLYPELSTARLLVMAEVQGVPVREAPAGEARKEAARQLLESFYEQVLNRGFFHADPHPGNLMWADGRIYFLDLGMAGELGPQLREMLLLLLLAFWQEDAAFMAEVMLGLAEERSPELDIEAFRDEMQGLIKKFRQLSLSELRLGPLLQQMTQISIRHGVKLPAGLALAGKAFGQMQLATAELDPQLDPFSVAGSFVMQRALSRLRAMANPEGFFYKVEKFRVRVERLIEALEGVTGARPGRNLQVDFRGTQGIEETIRRLGRRLTLAVIAGAFVIATGLAAGSGQPYGWLVPLLGAVGGLLVLGLLADIVRGSAS
jgi:predicted unusual protein kinase regulating ubiquinone biosynthesis (AarF/ABC1/UbiB family)/nucleotide-binding universal stress UspA family protein